MMTQTDGEICCVLGLEESVLGKWLYYPKQSSDSLQSDQIINGIFHNTLKKKFVWKFRTPKQPKQSWERKTELEGSGSLTSEFTTRPQGSRQYNTGTKNKYRSVGQDGTPRDEPRGPWAPHTWHRRHGVYDGEKTVSSVSAAVKTGQLHVKEPRTLPNATHKLKEDYRPEGKARHCKTLKGKTQAEHSKKLHQDLFWPPSYSNKNKNKPVGHN